MKHGETVLVTWKDGKTYKGKVSLLVNRQIARSKKTEEQLKIKPMYNIPECDIVVIKVGDKYEFIPTDNLQCGMNA